jgi:hypothetical protein
VAVVVAERLPVGSEVEPRVVGRVGGQSLLIAAVDVDREHVLVRERVLRGDVRKAVVMFRSSPPEAVIVKMS